MVQFIQDLRPRFKTALLSNASPQLHRLLDELDVTELFDVLVVSGVVGVQKPDPDIYRLVLKRLGLHPQETIFVDDFTRNIEAAQELGMQTLHFRVGMDWKGELSRRLGVDEGKGMTDDEGRKTDDG